MPRQSPTHSLVLVISLSFLLPGCAPRRAGPLPAELDPVAERYVKLALAMARHDPDYVDSYYGPPEWKTAADRDSVGLAEIALAADSLVRQLDPPVESGDTLIVLRRGFLRRQLESLASRAHQLAGMAMTYEQEATVNVVTKADAGRGFGPPN